MSPKEVLDLTAHSASRRSTLKDVAALAGVSIKTVSRALTGQSGVNSETLAKIQVAARKLDYRPNRLAQQLRTGNATHAMALLIGELHNPFYSGIAAGVESVLRPKGFDLFIASSNEDAEIERHLVENFIERSVEGILIVPASYEHFYLEGERQRGTPIVFLDRPPINVLADSVILDNRKAARQAVEHLFSLGHTRIAILSDAETVWTAQERIEGVIESYSSAKLDLDKSLIFRGVTSSQSAELIADKVIKSSSSKRATAFLALNNQITIGVITALQRNSASLGLVGFDDFDLADVLSVTVIRHSPFELGRQGGLLALKRLSNPDNPPVHLEMSSELIFRGSTNFLVH